MRDTPPSAAEPERVDKGRANDPKQAEQAARTDAAGEEDDPQFARNGE